MNLSIVIKARLGNSLYNYGNFSVMLIPFLVDYVESEITLNEHKQIGWFNKGELIALDWAPADIPVLTEFLRDYHVM